MCREIPFRTNVVIVREIPKYNGSDTVFFVWPVLLLNLFLVVCCLFLHPPCLPILKIWFHVRSFGGTYSVHHFSFCVVWWVICFTSWLSIVFFYFFIFICFLSSSCVFCLITLKSSEKWWSPLLGATCNFNDQILPYGILFVASINTNVFYLTSFKFSS